MEFLVVLEQDEDSGDIVADVPELPGCHTFGRTREEALTHIREAIELYLEVKGTPTRRYVDVERVTVES